MEPIINLRHILDALIFSFIGILIFVLGYFVVNKMTPGHLFKEIIEEHNIALAILIGAIVLGISLIIASAIHG